MPAFLYTTESTIVISLIVIFFVGVCRTINGGDFLEPDTMVKDGINGIVVFVYALLWYALIFDMSEIIRWSNQPIGKVAISMAMIGIIVSRLKNLVHSGLNIR